jgi:hypothetical protein
MKLTQPSIILLALAAACSPFQPQSLSPFKSSFTNGAQFTHRSVAKDSTKLNMMFDQLTTALTDVAKNFGPKKR